MKTSLLTLLGILLGLTFLSCNATKPQTLNANAHQQATTTPTFPNVKRPSDNVNCHNCYASFKLATATQKQSNGHSYIACPVCNKDYLKKSN